MEGLLHPFYLNQFKFVFGAPGYRESFCSKTYIKAFEPRMKIIYPSTTYQNHVQSHSLPAVILTSGPKNLERCNVEECILTNQSWLMTSPLLFAETSNEDLMKNFSATIATPLRWLLGSNAKPMPPWASVFKGREAVGGDLIKSSKPTDKIWSVINAESFFCQTQAPMPRLTIEICLDRIYHFASCN